MVGVGKILKQAKKIQQQMQEAEALLAKEEFECVTGGGALALVLNGQSKVLRVTLQEELLKEPKEVLEEILLVGINEALEKVKSKSNALMTQASGGINLPFQF